MSHKPTALYSARVTLTYSSLSHARHMGLYLSIPRVILTYSYLTRVTWDYSYLFHVCHMGPQLPIPRVTWAYSSLFHVCHMSPQFFVPHLFRYPVSKFVFRLFESAFSPVGMFLRMPVEVGPAYFICMFLS